MEQTLPFKELTQADLGTRDIARANGTLGEQVLKIALDKIITREGFNVRHDMGDIDGLAYSILENGQSVPGKVDILSNGIFVLTDGHRRFAAMQRLAEMGHEPFFKAIVNDRKTTEEQRILQMFTTQDSKHLEPHEAAELIQRLVNLGHDQSGIAKKIGKTASYVSQLLVYAREDKQIKDEVIAGNLSVATVVQAHSAIKDTTERREAVKEAVAANTSKTRKVNTNAIKDAAKRKIAENAPPPATPQQPAPPKEPKPAQEPTDPPVLRAARAIADFFSMPLESIAQIVNLIEANLK